MPRRALSLGPSGAKNLVAFHVGDIVYAVDIGRVREIIRPLSMMVLPHMPPSVVGVADHRGYVVPVLDLRVRFGVRPQVESRRERWVIVTRGDRLIALVVDGVLEVFGGAPPSERAVPEIGAGEAERGISAIYTHDGRLVFVVDVDRLTAPGEQLDLQGLRAQLASWRPDAAG